MLSVASKESRKSSDGLEIMSTFTAKSDNEIAYLHYRDATLIEELQTARLIPTIVVPGIEHQAVNSIVRIFLPSIRHRRRTLHRRIDEHYFLDSTTKSGVRVLACWDDRACRVRMHIAEIGQHDLWERIVNRFAEWELTGRPVPEATRKSRVLATWRPTP